MDCELDDHARVRSLARWGDPESTGNWGVYPFGLEVTGYADFGGVTIPSAGRAGWFLGTERWAEGEFIRYEITDYQLIAEAVPPHP